MNEFGEVISTGSKRQQLEAIRDRIAVEMDGEFDCCSCGKPRRSSGSETAALVQRLTGVLEALEKIPDETIVSRYDELKAKRDSTGGSAGASRRQGTGRRRRGSGA
ncbi:hypothetical protein [Streptomyces sp. OK228]|uniref:hypothetical protein n=1 Tax=Streptomyces sp. OK228 TaxID=1882786 RepID=UPI000BC66182|nr:hypothetical protein [Streptomyces sp. OK228]SOE25620.1 hypothetical protein SAMN05442782_2362 [Streptomyces sp. OK228]